MKVSKNKDKIVDILKQVKIPVNVQYIYENFYGFFRKNYINLLLFNWYLKKNGLLYYQILFYSGDKEIWQVQKKRKSL